VVTRYADVFAIGHDPKTFSSEPTVMIEDPPADSPTLGTPDAPKKMMLMMDPPMHTSYRKLISREFMPGSASALVPRLQQLAQQIVDAVIERGECDFVADIAGEMPSFVIAELMGLPLDDGRRLYELTEVLHTSPEALAEGEHSAALMQMFGYAQRVFEEKTAAPGDDLASQLIHAEVDGQRLDLMDFQLFFMLLVDAGGDTTRNLLSVSPVIYMRRTAMADVTLGEQNITKGDKVVMYYAAANRDAAQFSDPDVFDIHRKPTKHLAFGHGTHVCLGQHIARAEIDAMLAEVIDRLDNLRLAQPPVWLPSNFISGPQHMPVTFSAGVRRGA